MDAGRGGHSAWFPLFVLSVGALLGSAVALAAVIWQARDDAAVPAADPAGASDDANAALRYYGPLPASLAESGLRPAADESQADLVFRSSSAADALPVRYFVPVASLATGLDSVTSDDLQGLANGELTLAEVGGLGGRAGYLSVESLPDAEVAASFLRGTPEPVPGGYDALMAEVGNGDDALALIPLDRVTPAVTALAVDGIDLVRGRGDATAWPFVERVTIEARTERARDQVAALITAMTPALPEITTVVATGDILQARCSLVEIRATGDWGAALRGPVGEYLAAADLALGSLDTSIQDIGEPYGCVSTTNLTAPPETLEALTLAGIDGVTVATNHVFDCGRTFCDNRAFLRTLELLDQAGMKHVGGGRNLEEALAPAIFEINGVRFGVLGFDDIAAYELEATATEPGTAPLDDSYVEENAAGEPAFFRPAQELGLERFTARIRALKAEVDVVIVQVQTGTEDTHDPSARSIKALRAAAGAGADLIVGNQAHHAQAVEVRGGAYIAYALGNFIFDQVWTPEHTQGYLLEATFWGTRLANVRLVPYQIEGKYRPAFVQGDLRAKILGDVFDASARLAVDE
jgi:poly-gamma-glutamate synthesis protein (capsule biosynthesis protein)